jgi:hypothetical protein
LEVELSGGNAALGHAIAEAKWEGMADTLAEFLRQCPEAITFIKVEDRKPEVCLEAVRMNGLALEHISEQTPALCRDAVRQNGWALEYVKEQTPVLCLEAVRQNGWALEYVNEQTPELCLEAVRQNGWALEYVNEQTPELCLEAVRQDGLALQYAKEQTPALCLEAVRQDGWALDYVKEQTPELCLEAVRQHASSLYYVKEQTPEVCLEAVRQKGWALDYVKEQTPEVCLEAVSRDEWALGYVREDLYKAIPLEMRMAAADAEHAYLSSTFFDKLHAKLVKDDEAAVRVRVAVNPKASPETLTKLSQDEDAAVRRAVANNPHTPAEVLAAMKAAAKIPLKVGNVDITPEQRRALQEGKSVRLSGLVDRNGRVYDNVHVSFNRETSKFTLLEKKSEAPTQNQPLGVTPQQRRAVQPKAKRGGLKM